MLHRRAKDKDLLLEAEAVIRSSRLAIERMAETATELLHQHGYDCGPAEKTSAGVIHEVGIDEFLEKLGRLK